MPTPDYYKTLGVSKTATADEIRKAYRKLAKEYHPDAKPDDKAAAQKFAEIQEAYAVLGDKEKRQQYDQFGSAGFGGAGPNPFQGYGRAGSGGVDLNDLFGGQFGFGDIFGQASRGGTRTAAPRKGEDIRLEIEVPFQVAAEGGNHSIQIRRGDNTERLNVKIPAGVKTGSVIRLAGQGQPGFGQGPAGDLKLIVKVAPHPFFRRDGKNLLIDVPVTPSEAALGAKVEVPTLSEGNVTVTVPPCTSSGTKLRLRGKGVIDQKTGQRGDQFVVIKIVLPPELSEESQQLYRQLAELSPSSPRAGLWQ
ncbi:MAG: J domain-containing protein [Planctomycetaceae bacterium]